jgi:hypothetical protein
MNMIITHDMPDAQGRGERQSKSQLIPSVLGHILKMLAFPDDRCIE